jgi:hypothetical protein
MKPTEGKWKIFLIEPAEKITLDAANCLLKTLEEPPAWTVLILLARHKETLPATIVSRTQIVFFRPLPEKDVVSFLTTQKALPLADARMIAPLAEGSLSKAITLADEQSSIPASVWEELRDPGLTKASLLSMSQQYAKTAPEFLDELLAQAYSRYGRPFFISETCGRGSTRGPWLEYMADQCVRALEKGLPLQGICLYPIVDAPDWNTGLFQHCALWDVEPRLDGTLARVLNEPYAQALRAAQARVAPLLGGSE